jgi:hypothetical protein
VSYKGTVGEQQQHSIPTQANLVQSPQPPSSIHSVPNTLTSRASSYACQLQEHEDDLHEAASFRVCSASSICNPQHDIRWQLGSFPKDEEGAVAAQMPQHVVSSKIQTVLQIHLCIAFFHPSFPFLNGLQFS